MTFSVICPSFLSFVFDENCRKKETESEKIRKSTYRKARKSEEKNEKYGNQEN